MKTIPKRNSVKGMVSALALALMVVSTSGAQTASFQGLGPSLGGPLSSFAYGVSGDGSTIVGEVWLAATQQYAFRWLHNLNIEMERDGYEDQTKLLIGEV